AQAFDDVPDLKLKSEMLELAEHIIETKRGAFAPSTFDDRYESALADLGQARLEGRKIEVRKEAKAEKVVDLMAALRESAGLSGKKTGSRAGGKSKATAAGAKSSPARRKAG